MTALRDQAGDMRVSGTCTCGCSSVRLETGRPPVPTDGVAVPLPASSALRELRVES